MPAGISHRLQCSAEREGISVKLLILFGEGVVTVILDSLAEDATRDEILAGYPGLRDHHIDAALAYAAELAQEERLVPIRAM